MGDTMQAFFINCAQKKCLIVKGKKYIMLSLGIDNHHDNAHMLTVSNEPIKTCGFKENVRSGRLS